MIGSTRIAGATLVLGAVICSATLTSAASPSQVPGPTTGPAFRSVVSDDGRLTLDVPVAAIPAGVTPTATLAHTSVPSVAAYELHPADLALPGPVMATWQLDPAGAPPATDGDLVWLGLASATDPSTGPWEWLGDPHVDVVGGAYVVSGWLARFGTLAVTLQDARIHGPEAVWGPGYALPNGAPVDLELALETQAGAATDAGFSGDWRFGGGYPERIEVVPTTVTTDALAATWQCLRTGQTSLVSTFGVRETARPGASGASAPLGQLPGLAPAAGVVSVTFPIACGVHHPGING